ncbi:FERM central domain protein, partial [Ostertagia ostertagi]
MGKDGDPGGQAMSPKDPKMQAAKVRLLDGTYKDFSLHRGSDGEALFALVSADLSIEEREYFSLCFYDTEGTRNWLYNDKKILRQLKGLPWEFCYEVKFYPTAPSSLIDDHARYNLFLQLRNDVCSGRLPATIDTHATLGALVAQAQYGDAKPTPDYEEYLRTTKFAPQNSEQLLQMIAQKHKEHKGLTPAEAENLYLDTCKQQTMYGIFVFNAKDSKNVPVGIGICAHGIYIYKDQIRVNRFPWQGIIKISYRKNQFAIKLKAGEIDKKEATVVYKVSDYAHAKRIWKTAVEHHTFFRLIQPDEKPKSSLFRWGSARFRYQGRTQFQTKMASQMFDKPSNVTVQRTSSARLTHSLDNVAKEQVGSDHVSPLHYADNELGSREPMASPAVTYEVSGQSEKRKLNDKVGNGLPSDDDDELVYTPVESPSSAAYYLSERSSAYTPTSNEFGRSQQMRLTPLYSWKISESASTSADRDRYSYSEAAGSHSLPNRSSQFSTSFVDSTERRADIESLPINDTVQVYHAGHYQRLDRQPRRQQRNFDLNNQRINGVTSVRRLGPDEEMDLHPIRYFVNVQHSGSSHIPRVSRIRHPGREEVGAPNLSNYKFSSGSYSPVVRLEPGHELPPHNIRQYSAVYHPGSSQIVLSKQTDDEVPPVRLITRVLPTSLQRGHQQALIDGISAQNSLTSGPVSEKSEGLDRVAQFSTPSTSITGRTTDSSRKKVLTNSEPTQQRAYVFGRWRHDGDEEVVEKDRVRPETYGIASTSYKGPLESTTRHSDLPTAPLRDHAQVYHHGQSWDVSKGAKTPTVATTEIEHGTGKKAVLHLKGTPVKDVPSPAAEEETPKVRLIARVPHSTSEDETDSSKARKDHESSGLFSFWKSGGRKHRGDSQEGSEYPHPGKYTGPLDDVNRQKDIEQIPFKAPAHVDYKPASTTTSEPAQQRAYVFGRWRHDGDEEVVEKDRVRPETYGIASTSYKGPLESTTRHSDLPTAPLRDHAQVYHHGQSWDVSKGAKTPTVATTEIEHGTGKKAVLHLKGTPVKDVPSPAAEEETPKVRLIARVPHSTSEDETDSSKARKDHESSGLFSFWKSGGRKHRGDSQEGSEYPHPGKYTGPLDDVNRQKDIEQIPFKAPAHVDYKPASTTTSEPAQQRAYVFGRWRHDGDEEVVEKDRVRPETYGIASTSYKGPLESTTRHSDLPTAPLRDHAQVYHHGQSWDVSKGAKTPTVATTEIEHGTGKKAVLHLKGTPVKDVPSPAAEEETPKVRLIARVPHSTSEDETDSSKARKDHESSGLFSFWKSGGRKHRGDSQEGSEYPHPGKYTGPLDDVNRQKDIEQIPFKAPAHVDYKPASTTTSEPAQQRAYVFGRWRHDGDEEVVEKDRVRPETYGIASTSYKGPLESTTRHSDLPTAPLRDHAQVYHHGQSWDVSKGAKTPTVATTEIEHGTGKKAVLHLKGTPVKDVPSPAAEEETPKVRLIARVPHSTSEDETDSSKARKDHESSGLFSFWKSGGRKHRGDSQEGSEYPHPGKYTGPLDDVNRQKDIEQIPFKAPAHVDYKPASTTTSEPAQQRAYVFGRWRHDGDEEVVEKDRVRPETYGIASTSYKGPLESTTRHSDLPTAPLRDHAQVYHHGQSWDVSKGAKTPTVATTEIEHGTGKKAVLHLKGTPVKDVPSPAAEEETPKVRLIARVPHSTSEDETDSSKARKDHESSGLFSFWKSGGRKHRGDSQEGSEYPHPGKYTGPLDDVNRQKDIEQIPFKAPAHVDYKPASTTTSEPAQQRAYVFGRWRHDGDEEVVEKDRVRPETYGIASTSYKGPLESTTRHSDLPTAPLRDHAQVYHHGQSWDVSKGAKTPTVATTEIEHGTGKKAVLHLKGTPVKDVPSPAAEEETPKVRLIARVPHSTSEDETDSSKARKDHESSGLFSFWKSGGRKHRGDSQEGSEYPHPGKYTGPLDDVNRQKDIEQIPFKAPAHVDYKPASTTTSEPAQQRAYVFGRWRHDGDEEVVEKDRVRPETYGIASTSYKGPLESTTRHSDLPTAPLRDHAQVYHHGQSWDVSKGAKTPTVATTEIEHGTGKKAVLHLKGTPVKDVPSPAAEEETPKVRLIARVPHSTSEDETDSSKARKDHESSGLFSFWKSGGRKHRGDSQEGSEYPHPGKYTGPLDDVNRQKDIEQIPFKAPAHVDYKPASTTTSEPAQQRAYVFGRWRHDGDEEVVEKDRVRPETYGIASTSYKGPLESTTRHSDLPTAPLRDHAQVYHHGQSWDVSKGAKTPTVATTEIEHGTGKKAVLHLKGTPVKDVPSPAAEEETPKVRLIARVPHSTSEDETDSSKARKDHESSGLFSFWKSGGRKHRGDSQEGSEYPHPGKYTGPLDDVNRQKDIEQIPFKAPAHVDYKPASTTTSEPAQQRAYVFGRWRHDGDEEVVEKDRVRPETYGIASTSYKGPLESTTRHSDLPTAPLRDHAQVYHHGQSWDVSKGAKTPTVATTEIEHGTGKKAVLHLKGTPVKDVPSPAAEEETPKVRLIARVPHSTSEDETDSSKARKDHESSGLFSFWKSGGRKHRGDSQEGSEYPHPGKYTGPLDDVNRQKDIEQIPFKAPAHVDYKPASTTTSEPAQQRAYVFGRWRHDGDEEVVEKDRVRPETYGIASTSYKGPLESTTRHSDLPTAPLRDHAQVYHHGQSWDVSKGAKTPTVATTEIEHGTGKKAVLHLKGTPVKDVPSPAAEEETPKVRLIARVPHSTSEDETDSSKARKDHESSGLFSFWKSGGRKHRGDSQEGSEYPHPGKYTGPLDDVNRQKDIEQIPFKAPAHVDYKPASTTTSEPAQQRAYVFGRWRHDGDEEVVEKDRVRPETYGIASTSYKGPLESTTRHSDLPTAPLRDHAQVYHHGQSWDVSKGAKTPTVATTEIEHGTGKKAVLHLKGTPVKDVPSPAAEEETPKVRLIARVPHSTSEDETDMYHHGQSWDVSKGAKTPTVATTEIEHGTGKKAVLHLKGTPVKDVPSPAAEEETPKVRLIARVPHSTSEDETDNDVNRQKDIEQIPFKAPAHVDYKPASTTTSEPAQQRAYVFGRWRHDGDEEVVEKDRVRPETYGIASTSYKGPLESTTRHSDLPTAPLRDHAQVYHHGQSWDVSKGAKTPTVATTEIEHGTGKKAVLHLKGTPVKDVPSLSVEEQSEKGNVTESASHSTTSDVSDLSKSAKSQNSGLLAFWKTGNRKNEDVRTVTEYSSSSRYDGPQEGVDLHDDAKDVPSNAFANEDDRKVISSGSKSTSSRTYLFGRWRRDNADEVVENNQFGPAAYGTASTSYETPSRSTNRQSEPSLPLFGDGEQSYRYGQAAGVVKSGESAYEKDISASSVTAGENRSPSWRRTRFPDHRHTVQGEATMSSSEKGLHQHDPTGDSERVVALASSHTGRLEGRTLQGDEWVEVRVDRRAEVQLEPVFCLAGAGLRDLSEDEAGMIFSVTPPMPSSSRSFFSRLGFKSSSQKPKKQKKGKKETDSSDSSSSSEDEKNQIQVIPVESGGVTLPHYVDPEEKDGRVVRRETNELKYRLKGEGISPNFDPQNPSLASTMAQAERLNLRSPRLEHAERTVTVRALAPLPLSYEESGQPHTTISTWQESSRLPDEVKTEYDEKGNKITRTLKTSQVKHTVQKQTFQNYVVPTDEQPGIVTVERIREETTPLNAAAVATNGSAGSPHVVETHSRSVARSASLCPAKPNDRQSNCGDLTTKSNADVFIETLRRHLCPNSIPMSIDTTLQAIMEATQMNPDMTVEKIEVRQESTA